MSAFGLPLPEEYVVALRLRPTDTSFYELFTISAEHLVVGAGILAEMISDEADRAEVAKRMREEEHNCDENTHAIVRRVNSSFVTPFDREDIYALASGLDDVMDDMDEVVDLILLYEVTSFPAEVLKAVEIIQRCAEITAEAMPKLRSMTGLDEYWIEINRLENSGDKSYRRTLAKLFSGDFKAIEVLKLKDIVTSLEGAIDAFERVANIVEQIAVKES
jgi:predicted phosphate transport protein (TIGR00153 family)